MLMPPSSGPSRTAVVTALSAVAARNSAPPPPLPQWTAAMATPRSKSCAAMAAAMALHFFGYEFARGSNVALFTSGALGFGSDSGSYYPLAMACVGPASVALFLAYSMRLDAGGPRGALRDTTLLCASALASSGAAVAAMQRDAGGWAGARCLSSSWTLAQSVVWISFVFQNSYAQLLYAQQWSFLGSVCTPAQAGRYYGYVAGLSSASSMIAGASVSRVVGRTGLPGLLGIAAASLSCACALAEWAYSLSEEHGFGPEWERREPTAEKRNGEDDGAHRSSTSDSGGSSSRSDNSLVGQIRNGASLFRRVPTLGALFFEALTFQSLSTILNTCLVTQLRDAVPDDANRASWTGKFYASVNGLSTVFQFFVMPSLSKHAEPRTLWRLMPILPFVCGAVQFLPDSVLTGRLGASSSSSALYLIAASFLAAKTMDYSLRNILAEIAYMPLSFDARFKGKEIVAVFANRLGKSGMALILSGLHFSSGGRVGLSGMTLAVTLAWLTSVVCLSNLIPSKVEAERLVAERNRSGDDTGESKKEQ
jgi:hypothetical protein